LIVRRIEPEEWRRLRDLRLQALADTPEAFGSTLARERDYADDVWREWAPRAAAGHRTPARRRGRRLGESSWKAAVTLDVTRENDTARGLYETCGFVSTGRTGPFAPRPELVVSELRLDLIQ
jgi:hypothetical protein